jgi:tRNA(Ile)-lysidine synthase
MNYIVAVSGGVDSVVLLNMMAKLKKTNRIIVAHFDHGIRNESVQDARFVEALATQYDLPFESRREDLGERASEALARERRYMFLHELAKRYSAKIVTAHHQDDLIETIAINLHRGTGWRGLSVFANEEVLRPLIAKRKSELYDYACTHQLEWVEDETNQTDSYLRNRLRRRLSTLSNEMISSLLDLRNDQVFLRYQIENELLRFKAVRSRYFFIMIPEKVALEFLRAQTNARMTRPQLQEVLHAIKAARPGARLLPGADFEVRFDKGDFTFASTP